MDWLELDTYGDVVESLVAPAMEWEGTVPFWDFASPELEVMGEVEEFLLVPG